MLKENSKFLRLGIFAALVAGCRNGGEGLQSGDLIFERAGVSAAARAIDAATAHDEGESFSHVAIIDVSDEGIYVIEAASESGVRRITLDEFLDTATRDESGIPSVVVMRLAGEYDTASFVAMPDATSASSTTAVSCPTTG